MANCEGPGGARFGGQSAGPGGFGEIRSPSRGLIPLGSKTDNPQALIREVERFVASCQAPALFEAGEEPIDLQNGQFTIVDRSGRVRIEAWDDRRNISRLVTGRGKATRARMELEIERFGRRKGILTLVDQSRPANSCLPARGRRQVFREEFRRFLTRQFPGWSLGKISTEADLEHTLSPTYPRALVRKGGAGWAAIGSPRESGSANGVLTFGLIWLDYLRRLERRITVQGLAVFVPAGLEQTTCLRIGCLNPQICKTVVFVFSEDGFEEQIDPADHGNLDLRLPPHPGSGSQKAYSPSLPTTLQGVSGVEFVSTVDGGQSIRVHGLEIARCGNGVILGGIDQKRRLNTNVAETIRALAAGVSRFRSADAVDKTNPLYTRFPEAWLESRVRAAPRQIAADLALEPIYGQVPEITGCDRSVLDLLAASESGRLAVLELKAFADPHLPIQALDYWMRVRHHAAAGTFGAAGYFPQVALSREAPRLYLVAPALEFHPSTEIILRYFDRSIPVERVGLSAEWRAGLKVVFRASGCHKPGL